MGVGCLTAPFLTRDSTDGVICFSHVIDTFVQCIATRNKYSCIPNRNLPRYILPLNIRVNISKQVSLEVHDNLIHETSPVLNAAKVVWIHLTWNIWIFINFARSNTNYPVILYFIYAVLHLANRNCSSKLRTRSTRTYRFRCIAIFYHP